MLVLGRKINENIIVQGNIKINVNNINSKRVKIIIDTPDDTIILIKKIDESFIVNGNTKIFIGDIKGKKVKFVIDAPDNVSVHREELLDATMKFYGFNQ